MSGHRNKYKRIVQKDTGALIIRDFNAPGSEVFITALGSQTGLLTIAVRLEGAGISWIDIGVLDLAVPTALPFSGPVREIRATRGPGLAGIMLTLTAIVYS